MAYSPMQLAEAFIQAGELDDALVALDKHLYTHPDDTYARRLRARILANHDDDVSLRRALDDVDDPTTPDDVILCAMLYERLDDPDYVRQTLADGHAAHPQNSRIIEYYTGFLQKQGDIDSALTVIDSLADDWRKAQWRGDLLVTAGRDSDALPVYTRALDALRARYGLDSDHPAQVLVDESVSDAAAMTITGVYAAILIKRAGVYHRLGQLAEADADYASAIVYIPDDPLIVFNQALVARDRGDLSAAHRLVQTALDSASESMRPRLDALLDTHDLHPPDAQNPEDGGA